MCSHRAVPPRLIHLSIAPPSRTGPVPIPCFASCRQESVGLTKLSIINTDVRTPPCPAPPPPRLSSLLSPRPEAMVLENTAKPCVSGAGSVYPPARCTLPRRAWRGRRQRHVRHPFAGRGSGGCRFLILARQRGSDRRPSCGRKFDAGAAVMVVLPIRRLVTRLAGPSHHSPDQQLANLVLPDGRFSLASGQFEGGGGGSGLLWHCGCGGYFRCLPADSCPDAVIVGNSVFVAIVTVPKP